jgi:hypothetical protein
VKETYVVEEEKPAGMVVEDAIDVVVVEVGVDDVED